MAALRRCIFPEHKAECLNLKKIDATSGSGEKRCARKNSQNSLEFQICQKFFFFLNYIKNHEIKKNSQAFSYTKVTEHLNCSAQSR